jgi:hypothetical protein
MKFFRFSAMLALAGLVAFASSTRAELIHATTVTDVNGVTYNNGSATYAAAHVSDGSSSSAWVTVGSGSDYFVNGTTPVLVLDLGGTYNLTAFEFWNYYMAPGNGVKTFTLEFSADNSTWTTTVSYTTAVPKAYNVNAANVFEQDFTLSSAVTAQYVKITITDNWYGGTCQDGTTALGGDRTGFNEIDFVGTAAVPEPSAMMLFGPGVVALLAYAWRKRRKI